MKKLLLLLGALALVSLAPIGVLVAQDSTIVSDVAAGINWGAIIASFVLLAKPVLGTLLTSGIMYVGNVYNRTVRNWSNPAKYLALAIIGVLVSFGASLIGIPIVPDAAAWEPTTAAGLAQALLAALLVKLGVSTEREKT